MKHTTSTRRSNQDQVSDVLGTESHHLFMQPRTSRMQVSSFGGDGKIAEEFSSSINSLWQDFFGRTSEIKIQGDEKEKLRKRLLLLENEVNGMLKRKIQYSIKNSNGQERILDVDNLLMEKENQIEALERKIFVLEGELRRAGQREQMLEAELSKLKTSFSKLEKPNLSKSDIDSILKSSSEYRVIKEKYDSLLRRTEGFAGLLKSHGQTLRSKGINFELENELNTLIRNENLSVSVYKGIVNINDRPRITNFTERLRREVSIEDLTVQMYELLQKYPNLKKECDEEIVNFFDRDLKRVIERRENVQVFLRGFSFISYDRLLILIKSFFTKYPSVFQELSSDVFGLFWKDVYYKLITCGALQGAVEFVKYVPEIVTVENQYIYTSEKSKRVEFHLRILVKKLLEELMRLKVKLGLDLEIDSGVLGMIDCELAGIVDTDDILRLFRSLPKIVEVEKIVEKIVDRVIQVPLVVPVEKTVEKVIEVVKVQQVEKVVHVPIEVVRYENVFQDKIVTIEKEVEKIVEVPKVIEKIIEKTVEIPKVINHEIIREKIIEVEKPVVVEKIIHVPVPEIQVHEIKVPQIEIQKEIVEKAVPVEVFVEKIVEKIVHVPQIVPVEKRNDVLVKQIEVQNAREVVNNIQKVPEIVEVNNEVKVPLIEVHERIVEVPRIIEKIVEVKVESPVIKEVRVVEQKIVYQDRIKEIEVIVERPVEVLKEVEKIVQKRVDVPIIQQKIMKVPEVITQIVVEKCENPVLVEIEKIVEKIVQVPKIMEVEKPTVVYVNVDRPVKMMVEKIVEVPKTIERIKEVRVHIDKIIEKMVEVPKVVEVEKIVEKVVVVPRVIEKIVEVPKIVEKVVDRLVENTRVDVVERIEQVPIEKEVVLEVDRPINHFIKEVEVVDRIIEKPVETVRVQTNVQVVKEYVEKIIEVINEIPRECLIDKVVPIIHEATKVVEIEKNIVVPVEVPIPVDRLIDKIVPLERDVEKVVQVIQQVQKIVEVKCEEIKIQEIVHKEVQIVKEQVIKQVEKIVPYVQKQIVEVTLIEEKPVPLNVEVKVIEEVDRYIEKLVTETHTIIQAKEVERIVEKLVEVPKVVTVENVIPVLVEVNNVVECFVDRPIEIPILRETIKQVPVLQEKVVAIETIDTEIKVVEVNNDRIIEQEKAVFATNINNCIQTQMNYVDVYSDKIVPTVCTAEKIVEVPYVIEKIIEKVVVMPQVVELTKTVHEILEKDESKMGAVVVHPQQANVNVNVLGGLFDENMMMNMSVVLMRLLKQLTVLYTQNPRLKYELDMKVIQKFHASVEEKMNLLKTHNAKLNFNDFAQLSRNFLGEIGGSTLTKIEQGLLNDLMQQTFTTSTLIEDFNGQFNNLKVYSERKDEAFSILYNNFKDLEVRLSGFENKISTTHKDSLMSQFKSIKQLLGVGLTKISEYGALINLKPIGNSLVYDHAEYIDPTLTKFAGNFNNDVFVRLQGSFRALEKENQLLRQKHIRWQLDRPNIHGDEDRSRIIEILEQKIVELQEQLQVKFRDTHLSSDMTISHEAHERQIQRLNNRIRQLEGKSRGISSSGNIQEYEIKNRTLNSKIEELESQMRRSKVEYDGKIRNKDKLIGELEEKIRILEERVKGGDSRATGLGQTSYAKSNYSSSAKDQMSESQHSASSSQKSQSDARNYATTYTTSQYKNLSNSGASRGANYERSGYQSTVQSRLVESKGDNQNLQGSNASSGSGVATYGGQGYSKYYGTDGKKYQRKE